jgi:hypothetical protein
MTAHQLIGTAEALSLATSVAIPLISALLYRAQWNRTVVGLLSLLLATANGFLTEWAAAPSRYDWQDGIWRAALSFGVVVAAHYGVWKDTPAEGRLLAVGSKPSATRGRQRRA